jgi:hypothetical protein
MFFINVDFTGRFDPTFLLACIFTATALFSLGAIKVCVATCGWITWVVCCKSSSCLFLSVWMMELLKLTRSSISLYLIRCFFVFYFFILCVVFYIFFAPICVVAVRIFDLPPG